MQNLDSERMFDVAVSCVPERGWVVVQTDAVVELEHPIVELRVVSTGDQRVASTLVMDAPASFRVTLHLPGVDLGTSLRLQIQLISVEDTTVQLVGEYPFVFEPA